MGFKVEIVLANSSNHIIESIRIHVEGYLIDYSILSRKNEHKLRDGCLVRYLKGKSYIFKKDLDMDVWFGYNHVTINREISYGDILKLGLDKSHIAQIFKKRLKSYKSKPKKEPNQFKLMSKFLHGAKKR